MFLGDLETKMECSSWSSKEQKGKSWLSSLALSPQCRRLLGVPVGETAVKMLGNVASIALREQ